MAKGLTRTRRFRYLMEYLAFRTLVCVLQSLSGRCAARLAERMAFVVHRILPRRLTRYEVARQNIRSALGEGLDEDEIDQTIYRMWVHLFRLITEIVQLPRRLRLSNVNDVIVFRDHTAVLRALCSGRPVILVSGHYGNWEVAVSVFGLFGFPMGVVAREMDNPYLAAWFRRFRQFTGHRMVDKKGGYGTMLTMLERRGHLAMLSDQDAGPRGLFVDFFGHPASTFKSIALLAIQYRAVICVGYARRLADDFEGMQRTVQAGSPWTRFELGCEAVIDPLAIESKEPVREITQRYTTALERAVRRSPEQYFWVHRRWKSVPGRKRSKKDGGEPSKNQEIRKPRFVA